MACAAEEPRDGQRSARRLAVGTAIVLALAILVVIALLVHRAFGELAFSTDDAFIYTGYVKMAFTPGGGLYSYNPGEHSAGTTGIAYYLLLLLTYLPLEPLWPAAASPRMLELNSWILAGLCFCLLGGVTAEFVSRVCRLMDWNDRAAPMVLTWGTMAVFAANTTFLWGVASGMENPLAALLTAVLAGATIAPGANPLLIGAASAGLVATRPEWAPVAAFFPLLLAWPSSGALSGRRIVNVAAGYAGFFLVLLCCFGSMRFFSGYWLPAADGARVNLQWERYPREILRSCEELFFSSWGLALLAAWGAVFVVYPRRPALRPLMWIPIFLTLFLLMRAYLGLTAMNVRDRYISYLWPALVMTWLPAACLIVGPVVEKLVAGNRRACLACGAAVALIAIVVGTLRAAATIVDDTTEMMQICVLPSKWMAAHLAPGTVVQMEPAGAIRTFTDLRLVDRVGLTTRHLFDYGGFDGNWKFLPQEESFAENEKFLQANRVEYLFDYPDWLANRLQPGLTEPTREWSTERPWFTPGKIVLVKYDRLRGLTLGPEPKPTN